MDITDTNVSTHSDSLRREANAIPRRKQVGRHMSESSFVTGSMELKRNVRKGI